MAKIFTLLALSISLVLVNICYAQNFEGDAPFPKAVHQKSFPRPKLDSLSKKSQYQNRSHKKTISDQNVRRIKAISNDYLFDIL